MPAPGPVPSHDAPQPGSPFARSSARATILRAALASAFLLGACAQAPKAPAGPPTGIALYSRFPRFVDAKISPKGTYLAAISLENGQRSLTFVNLATRKLASRLKPAAGTMVADFRWVNDERVVADLVDQEGDLAAPKARGEIYAVNAADGNGHLVFGYRAGTQRTEAHMRHSASTVAWGRVLDTIRGDDRRFLVEAFSWDTVGDARARLYAVDAYSGFATEVAVGPAARLDYETDENGVPRLAYGRDADRKRHTYWRDPHEPWRELPLSPGARPLAASAKDRTVYVSEGSRDGFALYAVGVDGGGRKLLSRNDLVPPTHLLLDRDGRVFAVEYDPDLPTYEFVQPDHPLSRVLKGLLAAHPDEHVALLNTTEDEKKAVVRVYADRDPGQFLLVDVEAMSAEPIVESRPWIRPAVMGAKAAFHIQASDGLRIHGYLTSPSADAGGSPPPLVVYPHGGPHGVRHWWIFDPMVQYLRSEGFAVLEVNYRGSTGYGGEYEEAGFRHWGDRMIEDIVDATRWAMRKGYADPKRACVFGGSYGGYAALQAAVLAPDLFRCAIGYAGIYDLTLLANHDEWVTSRIARGHFRAVLGEDQRELERMSPVYHADRIKARVLLIHGGKDWRAEPKHATRMREARERAGNPPAWMYEPLEGHGFIDERARERLYARVSAFLHESTDAAPAR